MTRQELQALLTSARSEQCKEGRDYLVALLSAPDRRIRRRGYAVLREQFEEALYQSCLNYRGLVRGFTHPLESVIEEAIERWARAEDGGNNESMEEKDEPDNSGIACEGAFGAPRGTGCCDEVTR